MENKQSDSAGNKISLHALYEWLKRGLNKLSGKGRKTEDLKPVQVVTTHFYDLNKPYEDFAKGLKHFDDELVIPELQNNFMLNKKFMFDCGHRDGVLGITSDDIGVIAQTHAQNLFDQANVILSSKLAGLESELEACEQIKNRDERLDNEQHAYYDYLQHGYRYFPRTFSLVLSVIYFLCFIVLLIADIPLALRLIMSGFSLHTDGNLPWLFTGDTYNIIRSNWEVFTTAVGIAMCTVYIKIFYDEFIGTAYGSKYLSRAKFLEIFLKKKSESETEDATTVIDMVDKESASKLRWKYGIAIATVSAIVILALFRIHTLSLFTINPITQEQVLLTVPKGWQLDLAVIAITLIFPIISGICLSLSLTNIQNFLRLIKTGKDCRKCNANFIKSLKTYTAVRTKYENLESELKNWSNDQKRIENHKGILLAQYAYGKSVGIAEPDRFTRELDFYAKVELWRGKMLSRKINEKIIQAAIRK